MPDQHVNFGYSTVALAPSPATSGTTLTVNSGGTWPPVPFSVTCWPIGTIPVSATAEIMRVVASTGGTTPTFTVLRAQEGSTAQSIAAGYSFGATITALQMTTAEMSGNGTDVTGPPYFILQGIDQTTAINAMFASAPDGTLFYWPSGNYIVGAGDVSLSVPGGKHFRQVGAGIEKTIITTTSRTADIIQLNDWYNTFDSISFHTSGTTTTGAAALSTTAATVPIVSNAGLGTSGQVYIACSGSPASWQLVTYTGTTSTSLTGCTISSGTATTISGGSVLFRTAGYALNFGSNTNCNVTSCGFYGQYSGAIFNGTLCNVINSVWGNCINCGLQFNGVNVNTLLHNLTMDGLPPPAANILVQQCGSLLISDSDIIRGTNNLLLSPTSPNGCFGVYAINTFFDSATGSSVKFAGSGNIQRIKFTNCWLSGSVVGLECASTATVLPTATDLVNCDIYSDSTAGILWSAGGDFSVSASRIAGAATGISIAAGASAQTRMLLTGNRIGPTGGIGANGVGIAIAAGVYSSIVITGNDLQGNTTANLSDASTMTTPGQKIINNNGGLLPLGKVAGRTAVSAAVTNVETVLAGGSAPVGAMPFALPANSLRAGDTFRCTLQGTCTATAAGANTFRIRIGAAGTTADTQIASVAFTGASGSNQIFKLEINLIVTAIGATAALVGYYMINNQLTTGIATASAPGAVAIATTFNSAANNYLSLTYGSSVATVSVTFSIAMIELV